MKGVPNTKYIGYRKNTGNYYIQKRVKDKIFLFGTYETLEDAIFWRDYHVKHGWNLNERLMGSKTKFIEEYADGKYTIKKVTNGKKKTFGVFTDYYEALREVMLLKKCGWDWEAICESIDETIDGKIIMRNRIVEEIGND